MLHCIVSCRVGSGRDTSRRDSTHRIASSCIALHRIASIESRRVASHRTAPHRIASHRIATYRIVLYCIAILPVSTTDCKADVAFVADSSKSISELEWFMTKQFIIDVVLGLKAANSETRVSVISFSSRVSSYSITFVLPYYTLFMDLKIK